MVSLNPMAKKKATEQAAESTMLDDRLVVFDDGGNCEIYDVDEVTADAVCVHGHVTVPKEDCDAYVSSDGRVWLCGAPRQYVQETERLAALEQSMVLKQITQYKADPTPNPNMDFSKWVMAGIAIIAVIVGAF